MRLCNSGCHLPTSSSTLRVLHTSRCRTVIECTHLIKYRHQQCHEQDRAVKWAGDTCMYLSTSASVTRRTIENSSNTNFHTRGSSVCFWSCASIPPVVTSNPSIGFHGISIGIGNWALALGLGLGIGIGIGTGVRDMHAKKCMHTMPYA